MKKLENLDNYIESIIVSFEEDLSKLISYPTVSSDPSLKEKILEASHYASELLRASGFGVEIFENGGNPVVIGSYERGRKLPWITIYNHLDVQPAQEEGWITDPFVMRKIDNRYYGRGSTDDKGPALVALYAARYAMENSFPVNLRFIWEFEEEIGSPSFEAFLKSKKNKLKSDLIVVSDTIWISRKKPAISYFLRGLVGATLRIETAEKEVHSGLTGGAARNPLSEICEVISKIHDARTGLIKIPGFYKDVRKPKEQEMKDFLSSGFSVRDFMKSHGLKSLRCTDRQEVIKRIWTMPTFEVHVINSSYPGPALKTVIPSWAEAKVSMRIVPDQDPHRIYKLFKDYVERINSDIIVKPAAFIHPFFGKREGKFAKLIFDAISFGFRKRPVFVREGGSIGAVV
ncbi:MAG: M20/M25/M40 family metallo-hydrolase, partial [Candidatus Aenigmatarchaeota archaeon]